MKVGIFGHYGNANLGDEAITRAAIQSVRRHIPGAEIACFSINPADSEARQRHGEADERRFLALGNERGC